MKFNEHQTYKYVGPNDSFDNNFNYGDKIVYTGECKLYSFSRDKTVMIYRFVCLERSMSQWLVSDQVLPSIVLNKRAVIA